MAQTQQWRVYCQTQGLYFANVLSTVEPSLCPANGADTIDPDLTVVLMEDSRGQSVGNVSGDFFGNLSGDIDSSGTSYLSGTVDFTGGTLVGLNDNTMFQAYDSVGGLPVTNVSVVMPMATETIKDSIYTHSTVVNNSRVTVALAGLYRVSYSASTDGPSRHNVRGDIRLNGTTLVTPSTSYAYSRGTGGVDFCTASCTTLVSLATNDYIELLLTAVDSPASNSILIADQSWMLVERIR